MPYEFKIIIPETAVPFFELALEENADAVLTRLLEEGENQGKWELQAIFENEPKTSDIKDLLANASVLAQVQEPLFQIKKMPDINWLEASYQGFPPIEVGPYYIYGSHISEELPKDKITLQIDAATAFGTGEHQTTHGCLKALSELKDIPETVLDVGCGSGILGMAFAKTYCKAVDAVDIDEESVRVACENAQKNNLEQYMTIWCSNGYRDVLKNYDLIFCNILAQPLIDMAQDLKNHLNMGGKAILSGFLIDQEEWVRKAHEDVGLICLKSYHINGWVTLVMQRGEND